MAPNANTTSFSQAISKSAVCVDLATKEKDSSIYNAKVDPCHPSYDPKLVDNSKIIPNYGSKLQHKIYIAVSYILNWILFIIVMDCIVGTFWCPNNRYYTSQW